MRESTPSHIIKSMNTNETIILFSAFRYALGRSTYVVRTVADEIHRRWGELSDNDKRIFVTEILDREKEFGEKALGMKCDREDWMSIVERFKEEQNETV